MSGTKRAVAVAAVVAAVAAALIGWAVQANGDTTHTFTVKGKITAFNPVDVGPKGQSPGDFGVIAGKLTREGKPDGSYQGYCVDITDPGNSECTFTFALDGGQILVSTGYGKFNGSGNSARSPIIGGTDDYAKARGWIDETETGDDTISVVFHVQS